MTTPLQKRLRTAYDQSGVESYAELGRIAGISRAAVGQWFGGQVTNLRMEHLFKAARALGVTAEWLATGHGPMKDATALPEAPALLDTLWRLAPPKRVDLLRYGQFLLGAADDPAQSKVALIGRGKGVRPKDGTRG
jgi:transcriptional regulator with XRE-family HTH domain